MSKPTEIFVSYAWGGESEGTVNELERSFADHGLSIVRDKKELDYKGSIAAFEQRIGQGQAVILVISDKYLRSKHCMYELVEAAENRDLRARIYPIVLPDAQIYDAVDRLAYIQYWDAEIAELNQAIKDVSVMSNLSGITADLDLYTRIRANIDQLTDLFSDMNTLTPEIHAASEYTTLITAIETETQKSAAKEHESMSEDSQDKKSNQVDTGGGTYIGGSVNTGGGDFVGRDKITKAEKGGVAIDGNVTGSTIVTGNHNIVGSNIDQRVQYIQKIYTAIEERPNTTSYEKIDLKEKMEDIEHEDTKGEQADPGFIEHRLRNIQKMAPDILEVILATITNPVAGFGLVAKKVAEKIQAEAA